MTLNTVLVPVFPLPIPIQNVVMICYYAAAAAVRLAVARVEGVLKGKEWVIAAHLSACRRNW